jgi:hypothetical protein
VASKKENLSHTATDMSFSQKVQMQSQFLSKKPTTKAIVHYHSAKSADKFELRLIFRTCFFPDSGAI